MRAPAGVSRPTRRVHIRVSVGEHSGDAGATETRLVVLPPAVLAAEYAKAVADLHREERAKQRAFFAAIALSAIPVVLTWVWFSGRERRGAEPDNRRNRPGA